MAADGSTIHATCVAIGRSGILIRGPSGSGKSDLALRLLYTAASVAGDVVRLVSDDQVALRVVDDRLIAHAAPNLAGQIEVRGLGIMPVRSQPETTIGLVVDAVPAGDVSRMPSKDDQTALVLSVAVPRLELVLIEPSAVAKVLVALEHLRVP